MRGTERASQSAKYMITGTVLGASLDEDGDKNRPVNALIMRFLENGLPERHRAMEAER